MNEIRYNFLLTHIKSIATRYAQLICDSNAQSFNVTDTECFDDAQQVPIEVHQTGNKCSEVGENFISEENQNPMNHFFSKETPESILSNVFGYKNFRPLQRNVIQNVLDGRDTIAVMPTGGGKSLCYQIPALILDGLTVVISPLISLMQDQVSQLKSLKIPAVFLNSTLDSNEYFEICNEIRSGKIKLLYLSPESLNTSRIQNLLHSENVFLSCITVDESHCISSWGHDFRPDYLELSYIREQFPKAVCLALTATATEQVRNDIAKCLHMENPQILVSSFNRPNIYLKVEQKTHGFGQVLNFIQNHQNQSGIIYCFSRKNVDTLTQELIENGIKALNYHAGLSDLERTKNQEAFLNNKVDVMVATLAFGMGINKLDVRYVIHYDLPKSLEQYYQEIGRAGRDGKESTALLLFSKADIRKIQFLFSKDLNNGQTEQEERLLQGMVHYAQSKTCRRKILLSYFGENFLESENQTQYCCDVCTRGPIVKTNVTILAQKFMSCILRTGERYGASYIIDILLGSKNQKILERGHNHLSTFGIGKELSKENWFELCTALEEEAYIFREGDYQILYVTQVGLNALKSRQEIYLAVEFSLNQSRTKKSYRKVAKFGNSASSAKSSMSKQSGKSEKSENLEKSEKSALKNHVIVKHNLDTYDKKLFETFRTWRKQNALEANIPPFAIFSDKTLYDIIEQKPKNLYELEQCYGIGKVKLEMYGNQILKILNEEDTSF